MLLGLLSSCGRTSISTDPVQAKLEREDLVAVARALHAVEPGVAEEVAAARRAWPLLIDGLPNPVGVRARERILLAAEAAGRLALPALLSEREAAALTGPGSPLAGRYRDFQELCSASWRQIAVALHQAEAGPPSAARYARANVGIYVEGVYDAHYSLAEAGRRVASAYQMLGGAPAFGAALTQAEVDQLEGFYTAAHDRLTPHERVKLGS